MSGINIGERERGREGRGEEERKGERERESFLRQPLLNLAEPRFRVEDDCK